MQSFLFFVFEYVQHDLDNKQQFFQNWEENIFVIFVFPV